MIVTEDSADMSMMIIFMLDRWNQYISSTPAVLCPGTVVLDVVILIPCLAKATVVCENMVLERRSSFVQGLFQLCNLPRFESDYVLARLGFLPLGTKYEISVYPQLSKKNIVKSEEFCQRKETPSNKNLGLSKLSTVTLTTKGTWSSITSSTTQGRFII